MGHAKTKKLLCHGLAIAMTLSLVPSVPDSDAAQKKAKLAKKELTITQGKTKKIVIKNKKKKAKYQFKVSNKKVKVTSSGKVKALKVGKATVTVKEKYKKKTRKIGMVKVVVKDKKTNNNTKVTQTPASNKPTTQSTATPTPTAKPTATPSATPTATPPAKSEEVYKNYFEDGDTKGFTGRGGSVEVSNSENHTEGGMNSLLVTGRSASWHGATLPIAKYVEVGETYQFSAWAKQDSGQTQKIALKLQYTDAGGTTQYKSVIDGVEDGVECASGQWMELKGEYKIPENGGDIQLYLEAPDSETIDFLVDDVVIIGKPTENKGFQVTDEVYQEMTKKSVYSTGNNARIKSVIQKARDGEDVTLAYIGGSITEGALASPNSNCYAEVSAKAFGKAYGKNDGENVHFINAGMSGTPSDIGVVRYNRDVISRLSSGDHPDILFIEFAVNDYGCATGGKAYEGLIRQALKSGSAVVLIFSVFKQASGGRVCENYYRPYGEYYDIPMVSMGDAIMSHFSESGFYDWYFGDNLHPNNTGYKLMSDCIMKLMDTIDKQTAEKDNIKNIDAMAPKKSSAYQGIKILDASTEVSSDAALESVSAGGFTGKDTATGNFQYTYNGVQKAPWFPDNWMHTANSGSDSLKIRVKCKTLMLVYKLSSATAYGAADLYIDGVKKSTLSCYDQSGWNNGKVYLALEEDEVESHDIELKMADGSESKNFTLMAIGYN